MYPYVGRVLFLSTRLAGSAKQDPAYNELKHTLESFRRE